MFANAKPYDTVWVAHAFHPDGQLAYTYAGNPTRQAARDAATRQHAHYRGGWWVVETVLWRWREWCATDHSLPVEGFVVETGGFFEEPAPETT